MEHFDWIKRHAERTPDKLALIDADSGQKLTYSQLNARASRFSNFLQQQLAINKGDRISILAQNSATYYEIELEADCPGNDIHYQRLFPALINL